MSTTITPLEHTPPPRGDDGFGALSTEKGNLPLEKLDVRLSTTGLAVQTELTQGFRNSYDEPLEAIYIFPLPDRSAVTSLRMEADNRTVEGDLREREQARADYKRAIGEGKRASIAEEERPGVFTMRVGNILPGERVSVRLTLAGHLPYEDGQATLRFPLVVAPRYIPGTPVEGPPVGSGTEPDTDQVPDASRITPPVLLPGFPSPVELSISADIDPAGLPLAGVASSLHPIATEEGDVPAAEGGRLSVRVHPGERADRDFILRLRLGSDDAVTSSLVVVPDAARSAASDSADEPGEAVKPGGPNETSSAEPGGPGDHGDGTFALTILPPALTAATRPRDMVFVLDRSGSMGGKKMVAARRAAARMVDTLSGSDRFAVLCFDNRLETPPSLPDGLVEATDRHRFRAVEHLATLEARGGTEMLRPLLRAAELLSNGDDSGERERALVLVTDGQVGNEDQILRELADRLPESRIHTVGIDVAVNEAFLRRLATLGGGHYELVESDERLDEALEAIHRRIGTPLVTNLEVSPDGLDLVPDSLTPDPLPALYAGAPLVVTGRYRGRGDGAVRVSGLAAGGTTWTERLGASLADSAALAAVWARARLRDLEDRYVTVKADRRRDPRLEELERRIVATSLRFNVLCRFTAYVAIDSRVVNEGGQVRRVTQPVDLPQGWQADALVRGPMLAAGMGGRRTSGPAMAATAMPAGLPPAPRESFASRASSMVRGGLGRAGRRHAHQPGTATSGRRQSSWQEPPLSPALLALARDYLQRLREAAPGLRPAVLAEVRAGLERLLPSLAEDDTQTLALRPLRHLVRDLHAYERIESPTPAETERVWLRTTDVLAAFAGSAEAGPTESAEGTEPTGRSARRAEGAGPSTEGSRPSAEGSGLFAEGSRPSARPAADPGRARFWTR